MEWLESILASVFLLADGVGEGFVAIALGFAVKATGIGFLVGAALMLIFQSVAPVSFQVESLTVISRRAKGDWRTMCYAVILAGLVGAMLGAVGVYGALVTFIGEGIQGGMMMGAGLILTIVAIELLRESWKIGLLSGVVAIAVFLLVGDLVWALVASVGACVILGRWVPSPAVISNPEIEKVSLVPRSWQDLKFFKNPNVIRATLAILALRTGTSIAYTAICGEFAGVTTNFDMQNILIGISGISSALFGGATLEPIVSPTAATPLPIFSGVLFMALMGIICLTGVLPKIGRWVPIPAVSGILIVIGAFIVIPENLSFVMQDPVAGGVTAAITAATMDPFLGMLVGLIVRAITGIV